MDVMMMMSIMMVGVIREGGTPGRHSIVQRIAIRVGCNRKATQTLS
jgi:hypothetical protein